MAVVKYIRPRGDREAVLRFDWRAQVCNYELVIRVRAAPRALVGLGGRACGAIGDA